MHSSMIDDDFVGENGMFDGICIYIYIINIYIYIYVYIEREREIRWYSLL